MECLYKSRLRQGFQIVWHKAQRYEYIGQQATQNGEPLFVL
jgi:hypothetical protein